MKKNLLLAVSPLLLLVVAAFTGPSNPTDRIQRAGGRVIVSSAGNVTATTAAASGVIQLNSKAGSVTIGDVGVTNNGTQLIVNDNTSTVSTDSASSLQSNAFWPISAGGGVIGDITKPFSSLIVGGAANTTSQITGTFTANRQFLLPDLTMTFAPGITQSSGTGKTVQVTGDVRESLYKATFTFAAFSAAALTADATIATLPAKTQITGIWADVTTTFLGGAVATTTMTCGKTAGGNEYLLSFDIRTAVIRRGLADADLGASISRATAVQGGDLPSFTATTTLQCRLTTTGANTNALTQGSITYYVRTFSLP